MNLRGANVLADVLTSAASWNSEQPLLTYTVPVELVGKLRPGQLVAIPYGERLVEGVIWHLPTDVTTIDVDYTLRPISAILDPEPALLPHQRALAEWMAEYYVTPLAHIAMMMLPPGLVQRSRIVLQMVKSEEGEDMAVPQPVSLRLQALQGLLLAEGALDIEHLKKMLGPTRAREIVQEALASGLVERNPQLAAPLVKKRIKRVVRLTAQREVLEAWRQRTEAMVPQSSPASVDVPMAPDNVRRRPKKGLPSPWAVPGSAETLTLTPQDQAGLLAQRQLAAIELLLHGTGEKNFASYWVPTKLCQASKLTPKQLQALVDEQIISIEEVEVQRSPLQGQTIAPSAPLALTPDQKYALDQIVGAALPMHASSQHNHRGRAQHKRSYFASGQPTPHREDSLAHNTPPQPILLHGVTGSGKTEVYLQALAAIIAQGKRGIVLVPEIVLTTQAIQRFAGRFPGKVAIIHGDLFQGERYDEWRRIRSGQVDVVIGSRSALFAPLPDLGIIILDEEHEPAYKQSELKPTYHAREAALTLGRILCIPVVLGSATPAIESFYRAQQKAYTLIELPGRIGASLPPVEVIDLRSELHAGNTSIISRRLQSELERVLRMGQQAILFLNRRGAASCVLCRDCGFVAMCDQCDIPLTYHSTERVLLCHYCNRQAKILHVCPQCGSPGIRYFGLGTEKVMATIGRSFPTARLLRWDRDTASNHRAHQALLDRFANREADIMVGTQMIAKGLDLPGVTLVGVVSADIALNLPDFAASERAFTLLTQVAGRAGRGEEAGHVIIQTFNPQHFCIDAASRHDYHEFYAAEIEARRRYGYPPFRQFVKFTYSHENRRRAQNEALLLHEHLDQWIDRLGLAQTDVVGPAPALIERVRNKYRWQMIARGPDLRPLLRVIEAPNWEIDIDPVSTL
jgi:primosomal protein N' (replication factor Y) (superfamily II helicase)